MRLAEPGAQRSGLRSGAKHPRADAANNEGPGLEKDPVEGNGDEDDGSVIIPARIKRPIIRLVDQTLATAWKVNPKQKMCFIFDAVSPARRFKRGMAFKETIDFPEDTCDGDITETDGPGPGWMPVDPTIVRCAWSHSTPH